MKQLTMTKVLTPIAALAFAFGVQAAAVSTETFDTYATDSSVTNWTGWSFAPGADLADDASAVTAYESGTAPTGSLLPDGLSAGANFLTLSTEDGTLFRNMGGLAETNSVDLNAGLFVDTDVQFTITDSSDRPTPTADDKFIIWLEDNNGTTNLCAYAYSYATDGTATPTVFTLAANAVGDSLGIVPGTWYRLTVKAIANANAGGTALPGFQVYLNGNVVYTTDFAASGTFLSGLGSAAQDLINAKKFLPAMASEMTSLKQVGFSGEGKIDSVAVTHDIPADFPDLPRTAITFSWDSPAIASVSIGAPFYETVTNSGSVLTATPGQAFTMTVNYASGYSTSTHDITAASGNNYANVDGMAVSVVSAGAVTIAFTATAKDTVDVTFDWSAFFGSASEAASAVQSIVFNVGGAETPADLNDPENKLTLNGLKVGTNITVTVTFSPASWTATLEQDTTSTDPGTATLSIAGNGVRIDTRGDGKATVIVGAESAAPTIPVVSPGTNTVYTFATAAAATAAADAMNDPATRDTYITPPGNAVNSNYASYFTAFADDTTVTLELNAAGTNALETASTNAVAQVASSLSAIAAADSATTVTVSGLEPGFYYAVAYAADLATVVGNGPTGVYRTIGTAVLVEDSGEVSLNIPAKTANATAGFYRVLVFVTNPNPAN